MDEVVKSVSVSALRDGMAAALRKVEHEGFSYVLHRHGQPVAVLMPMAAAHRLWEADLDALRGGPGRPAAQAGGARAQEGRARGGYPGGGYTGGGAGGDMPGNAAGTAAGRAMGLPSGEMRNAPGEGSAEAAAGGPAPQERGYFRRLLRRRRARRARRAARAAVEAAADKWAYRNFRVMDDKV